MNLPFQIPFVILLVLAIGVSCRSGKPAASGSKVPDSLSVTITAMNLSEDLTGNDEVLIIFYVDNDTSALDESFFHKRVVLNRKSHTCKLKSKIPSGFSTRALVVFLLELDAELPFQKVDSILRESHHPIRQAYTQRNYTAIENYLGDEDILGIKIFRPDHTQSAVLRFSGVYKLDRYEYVVKIVAN